jgi:hypothetical protein
MPNIKFSTLSTFLIFWVLFSCNTKDSISNKIENNTISEKVTSKSNKYKDCNCKDNLQLADYISCDETLFSNGAKIYRQFNCDSSWLVFQNKNYKKIIYSLDKQMIEYTHKLGYVEWNEYEKSILIENKVVSGCCQPNEFVLIDKENGNLIKELGKEIFLDIDNFNPIFVSLDNESKKLNFYNLNNRESRSIDFNFDKIDITIKSGFMFHPEELFEDGSIKNDVFKIKYRYKLDVNENWKYENVSINLNKLHN